jgi:hypothetical protein
MKGFKVIILFSNIIQPYTIFSQSTLNLINEFSYSENRFVYMKNNNNTVVPKNLQDNIHSDTQSLV